MVELKSRLSWGSAICMMWRGKAEGLGRAHKIKSLSVVVTVIFTVSMPIFNYFDIKKFSGALPPEAPLIRTAGEFSKNDEKLAMKQVPYFIFTTDNGVEYRTENRIAPGVVEELGGRVPRVKVNVEGFILRNGNGSFYPLKIIGEDGRELASSDELMKRLLIWRDFFYYKSVFLYFAIISVFWGVSFYFAARLRQGFVS
ncbi:hypothetical protein HX881_20470 [Pseudomonas gingeri]|uniref:hypothetical protein n=1 Tax=Pseudomonas gingeri TaxID=117681 RepID=UPI0015A2DEE6|nr:hypothetical protein [Pseudomonas gingeri]NVZ27939.1 hypothetical protein [Pseudomonas gingeri]